MGILDNIRKRISAKAPVAQKEACISPPQTFFLELTNHCNLRCSMCNFHSPSVVRKRRKGFMSPDLAGRLLREISVMNNKRPWVALHGAGEPVLHGKLVDILLKGTGLNLDIGFLTNAMLLGDELSRKILDTGISWIGFSIDGIDREQFSSYRCGADYDVVLRNTLNFVELAKKRRPELKTIINMTLQEEMKSDVRSFLKFWLPRADEVCISPCRPVGSRINQLARDSVVGERTPCYMLYTMMVLYWDGTVGLCCEDWFNDGNIGNAAKESLEAIWNGQNFSRCRVLHERGEYRKLPLCGDCNSWRNSFPQSDFDSDLNCRVVKTAWQYKYHL
ncbi:MAG: SPASM domain-containing protein [Candidatus Sulfobium sp.]